MSFISDLPRAVSGGRVDLAKSLTGLGAATGSIRELVDCTGNSATTKALTTKLPPGARPRAVSIRCTTAGTVAGDNLALGIVSGDVDAFFTVAKDSIDDLNDVLIQPCPTDVIPSTTAETSLALGSVSGGSLSGNITAGVWDVTVFFDVYPVAVSA